MLECVRQRPQTAHLRKPTSGQSKSAAGNARDKIERKLRKYQAHGTYLWQLKVL
jgi:hypothetical protein